MKGIGWIMAGVFWMGMMGLLFAWQAERVTAHKLRANLAASCAVNQTPPMYWQPTWSHE